MRLALTATDPASGRSADLMIKVHGQTQLGALYAPAKCKIGHPTRSGSAVERGARAG